MKKIVVFLLLTSLGLLMSCDQHPPTDDPEMLKSVLTDYFDGLKHLDLNKMNALTSKDFVSFEDGKIWTNDSLIKTLSSFKHFQGTWKFDNMKVNVDNASGDITYFDHGEFVINDTIKMNFDWLESATFRKIDGKWKMNFLHSTVRKP